VERDPAKHAHLTGLPAAYAALTGAILLGWWIATVVALLPDELLPVQRQASHVVAELLLALALLTGSWAHARNSAMGRHILGAAFGGLLYATVNVLGDYGGDPAMVAVLAFSVVLTSVALIVTVLR
jgi:hypothetical protein